MQTTLNLLSETLAQPALLCEPCAQSKALQDTAGSTQRAAGTQGRAWPRPSAAKRSLQYSYVAKYSSAVGMVPSTAPVRPRYTSRGPCRVGAHAGAGWGVRVQGGDMQYLCQARSAPGAKALQVCIPQKYAAGLPPRAGFAQGLEFNPRGSACLLHRHLDSRPPLGRQRSAVHALGAARLHGQQAAPRHTLAEPEALQALTERAP